MAGITFRYWYFWDYPRNITLILGGRHFYLNSPFLDEEDEFATYYEFYELLDPTADKERQTRIHDEFMKRPPEDRLYVYYPSEDNLRYLGRIPIQELGLAQDRRSSFSLASLLRLLAENGHEEVCRAVSAGAGAEELRAVRESPDGTKASEN